MASVRKQVAQRQQLAQLAARLMVQQGIRDYRLAKQKAAQQMGIDVRRSILPKNTEVEAALAEHQRLFAGPGQRTELLELRRAAVAAMRLMSEFRPRLVGDVLSGVAHANSIITLHVFADHSESFDLLLQEHGIPFEIVERRYRFSEGYRHRPTFCFVAGEHRFEATLFSMIEMREAPRSRVDGTPMKRASLSQLEQLIQMPTDKDILV